MQFRNRKTNEHAAGESFPAATTQTKERDTMRRIFITLVALVAATLFTTPAAIAATTTQMCGSHTECTTNTTKAKAVEKTAPAGVRTTTTQEGSSTTVRSSNTQFNHWVRKYQSSKKTKVVFYWRAEGLSSKHHGRCTSPVRRGWIRAGRKFSNTYKDGGGHTVRIISRWKRSDVVCGWRIRGHGRHRYVTGTIRRCGNAHIRIYLHLRIRRHVRRISVFKSKTEFQEEHGSSSSSSSTTTPGGSSTHVEYYCAAGGVLHGMICSYGVTYICTAGTLQGTNCVTKVCHTVPDTCPPPGGCQVNCGPPPGGGGGKDPSTGAGAGSGSGDPSGGAGGSNPGGAGAGGSPGSGDGTI